MDAPPAFETRLLGSWPLLSPGGHCFYEPCVGGRHAPVPPLHRPRLSAFKSVVWPNILCSDRPVATNALPPAARIIPVSKEDVVSSLQKVQIGHGNQVSPNCFQIFLKTPAEASSVLWVKNTDKVLDLKQSITGKHRYPVQKQILIFEGKYYRTPTLEGVSHPC